MASRFRLETRTSDMTDIVRTQAAVARPVESRSSDAQSVSTIEHVSVRMALPMVVTAGVLTTVLLIYLTRAFDFFSDEWTFVVNAPHWTLKGYFQPHSEHWVTLLMVWYKLVFSVVGASNYHVFMAGVLAADAAVAVLLFLVIRQRSGDVLALAAAAVMLVLGSGWEDILWAFQIGWAGCVAFGLAAVLLLRGQTPPFWRPALASGALLCSLMCGGPGLFWLALVSVDLLFSPPRRHNLWVVVPPALAYLAWFAAVGHSGVSTNRSPLSMDAFEQLVSFVPTGIGGAFSGMLGTASRGSEVALVVVAAALGIRWYQRAWRVDSLVLGAIAGLVAEFVLVGLVRGQFGDLAATTSRYVWMGAVFGMLIVTDAARGLPWNRLTQSLMIVILAVSLGLNGLHLRHEISAQNTFFRSQDAELQVTWMVRQAPDLNRAGTIPIRMAGPGTPPVTVGDYVDSRAVLGSRLAPIQPSDLPSLDAAAVNVAFANALPARTGLVAGTGSPETAGCTVTGASGTAEIRAADRSAWLVTPSSAGPVTITVWYEGGPATAPTTTTVVGPGESLELVLPDSGLGLSWHVQAAVPQYLNATICPNAP